MRKLARRAVPGHQDRVILCGRQRERIIDGAGEVVAELTVCRTGLTQAVHRSCVAFTSKGGGLDFDVFDNDILTIYMAIKYRLIFINSRGDLPIPVGPRGFARLSLFRSRVLSKCIKPAPWTMRMVVDNYEGKKRAVYEKALTEIEEGHATARESHVKAFVKFEKLLGKEIPRVIQPREPRYALKLGCYIKPAEPLLFEAVNSLFEYPAIVKGMTQEAKGALARSHWETFDEPVCVMFDNRRHDAHTRRRALVYEHGFYKQLYPGDVGLLRLLKGQLVTHGRARARDGWIKFKLVKGSRCSGDMNTSLGNCLIVTAMPWSYFVHLCKFRIMDDGDDLCLFLDRKDLHYVQGFVDYVAEHGYSVDMEEPVYTFEHIRFCQTSPLWVTDHWTMARDPRVILSRDLITTQQVDSVTRFNMLRKAISDCGVSLTKGQPILHSFYSFLGRGAGQRAAVLERSSLTESTSEYNQPHFVTPDTRVSFQEAFGYSVSEQLTLESYFDSSAPRYKIPDVVLHLPAGLTGM